jgi:hypothetical protein
MLFDGRCVIVTETPVVNRQADLTRRRGIEVPTEVEIGATEFIRQ